MKQARPARLGSASLLGFRTAAYGLSGAGAVVVGRFLGPAEVGAVAAATSIVTILLVLGPVGIDQLYLQGRLDEATARRHLWRVAASSAAVAVVGSLLWPGLPPVARVCGVLVGLAAAGDQLKVLWLCEPQRRLDFATRGRRDLGMRALSVLLSTVAAVVVGTAVSVAAGTLVASTLVCVVVLRRNRVPTLAGPRRRLGEVVRPGLPFALSGALSTVYFQLDGAILASVRTAEEVGLYRAAYSFVFAAVAIPFALNGDILRSRLFTAVRHPGSLWALSLRFAVASAVLGLGASVVLRSLAKPLLELLFGPAFIGAAPLLAILALALLPHHLNSWSSNVLVGIGRVRQVVLVQGFLVAATIAGNLYAIPRYGARGAAWTTVACEGLGLATYLVLVGRSRRAISGDRPLQAVAPAQP